MVSSQIISSVIAIFVTIAALFIIWRGADNRLILDNATERILTRLENRVTQQNKTIAQLEQDRERNQRDIAKLNGMLDSRDMVVRQLVKEMDELKAQMESVTHDYRVQVDHWQKRALAAEAQIEQSKGRKL